MITVPVRAESAAYDVFVGAGLLDRAGDLLPPVPGAERAFIVADARVAGLYVGRLAGSLALPAEHLAVPEGEAAKALAVVEGLYGALAGAGAHRHDPVLAMGGGAVGDAAGFVAATYMRGVPLVQVPTTLTAQVDAAVGGKVAVNLPAGKNLVGAFHQPVAVVADVETLATLPEDAFRSGLGEVVKYGLAVDPSVLRLVESSAEAIRARDPDALAELVAACVRAKASVVAEDERDTGRRAILNYGHTLGHALERLGNFRGITHGDAVARGMVFAARLAESLGLAPAGLAEEHRRVLAFLGLPAAGGAGADPDEVLEAMRMDKKYRGGLRLVLLTGIGEARVVDDVPEEAVRAALAEVLEGGPGAPGSAP